MLVFFPDADALKLALLSGAAPAEVAASPVEAAFGAHGEVWLRPARPLSGAESDALARFGARLDAAPPAAPSERLLCWHQAIPLERAGDETPGERAAVLFDVGDGAAFVRLAAEMLRLGNDRQSYRQLDGGGASRTLLRVVGPPYYSLLRASEGEAAAYVEQSPRLWTRLGWRHPFAARLHPPAGKLLLLRPPRDWELIPEAPFRDLYEAVDFQLPDAPLALQEGRLERRIAVPLRLIASSATDAAELWVLRDEAIDEMERLVAGADDRLLSRLAFAVGSRDGRPIVALRVRPSKQPPPALVLRGEAFRPYLKLPNLFVPLGRRLHPPLRRDAAAKLLAADAGQIVWLHPLGDGAFAPESLPDGAFRPLADWIDYVIDHDRAAIDAWTASHRFDFEPFVCRDGQPAKPPAADRGKAPRREPPRRAKDDSPLAEPSAEEREKTARFAALMQEQAAAREAAPELELAPAAEPDREALFRQLRSAEERFTASAAPLDDPSRRAMWRQMAALHAALDHRHDATLCWSNALWEDRQPAPDAWQGWLATERRGAAEFSLDAELLDLLLLEPSPAHGLSLAAAWLAWGAQQPAPPQEIADRLAPLAQMFERHERLLPVRTAWLVWTALYRLSHGDTLLLARARDRLLERLHQGGLAAELDLPGFLTAAGQGDRLPLVRERLPGLRKQAREWSRAGGDWGGARTLAYLDLIFAWAMARVGQGAEGIRLAGEAAKTIPNHDPAEAWLRDAFLCRVQQASRGEVGAPLDAALLKRLESLPRMPRYVVDRLREHSRILEPHERNDPYRRWRRSKDDAFQRRIFELHDVFDRQALAQKVRSLLGATAAPNDGSRRMQVLLAALEVAPRLGDETAGRLLREVGPALDGAAEAVQRATILGKAMFVAGHFDQVDEVRAFARRFEQSLAEIVGVYFALKTEHNAVNHEVAVAIEEMFSQSLRSLRKLGLKGEIDRILDRTASLAEGAVTPGDPPSRWARGLRLRLSVAGGWLYFGRSERAEKILDEARQALWTADLAPADRKSLACAYLAAVGLTPAEAALARIQELLSIRQGRRRLGNIEMILTTSAHYSLAQLDVVEAAALALVSDDFSASPQSRQWLDEDEFLVRRRIHRDVREALGQT